MSITHTELIEKSAAWLRAKSTAVVITDMTSAISSETADVIGWNARGVSSLIEVKISRADFLADRHKPHRRMQGRGMGFFRFYCAPKGMLKPEELPLSWGLLEWNGKRIVITKPAEGNPFGPTWDMQGQRNEMALLIGALRRIGAICPQGVSVKAYQYPSKCRATLGTALPQKSCPENSSTPEAPHVLVLREALECLFNSYKALVDSGDAGCWKLEDTDEGKKALLALAAVSSGKEDLGQ